MLCDYWGKTLSGLYLVSSRPRPRGPLPLPTVPGILSRLSYSRDNDYTLGPVTPLKRITKCRGWSEDPNTLRYKEKLILLSDPCQNLHLSDETRNTVFKNQLYRKIQRKGATDMDY